MKKGEFREKFLSILVTALLSALIAFLQSLIAEISLEEAVQVSPVLASGNGLVIRTVQEFVSPIRKIT